MDAAKEPILQLPETVREDVLGFRGRVDKFLREETSPIAFKGYRVPMGVYEQRAVGKYMIRIRIGAGLVLPYQLNRIAQLSKAHGNGVVHITTRQDIQLHEVDIENAPDAFEGLLKVGLASRGGGGNTVRNVTACPRAGVCPKEVFDVSPYSIATAEYLLYDRSSFNLPRKFKLVFSGCSEDCAFASTADLAFFAHLKDGVKGFAVYSGGGLGPNPSVGVKIEDFVKDDEIFVVAEAVKQLFDTHGDRANKHKARLRYVLARVGKDEFVNLYKKEKDKIKAEGLPYEAPEIRDINYEVPEAAESNDVGPNVMPEKIAGRFTMRLWLRNGDIPADDLVKVGQIAEKFGQGIVRTTQLQDILITGVAGKDIEKVNDELKKLSINVIGDGAPKVVACAGASTCKLGLCLSRGLSDAILEKLKGNKPSNARSETVIRVSGCPNSCANHFIAEIGFQGKAQRIEGRLMPFYDVMVGAKISEGNSNLAEKIGAVPAKRIPELLSEAFSNGTVERAQMEKLVEKYSDITSKPLPNDYFYDYGSDEPFSLAGRGPGECGAGVMDVIQLDIDEAKEAIKSAPNSEDIYKAIVAAARALLVTFGLEPRKDREIFAAFRKHIVKPRWVKPQTKQLLNDAIDWRMGDKDSIEDSTSEAQELINRVEELFLSLDASLKFRVEPIKEDSSSPDAEDKTHKIDLCGVACPLNFVKAKLEIEKIKVGEILEVILDDGEPLRNVPASFAEQGQEVLDVIKFGDKFCVKVLRKK